MKKLIPVMTALAAVLVLACSAALAECELDGYLDRIAGFEDPVAYTITTVDYDTMAPVEGYIPSAFINLFRLASVTPAGPAETPEGEYIALDFPEDSVRFDFFFGSADYNFFRQVNTDGTEELFRAALPEGIPGNFSSTLKEDADRLADALQIRTSAQADVPAEGWILDSIQGIAVWQSDRAALEVCQDGANTCRALVFWGSSAWENTEWTYTCSWDTEAQVLHADRAVCDNVVFDEDGNETRTNVFNKPSEAFFFLNEAGQVVILNAGDERLEGKAFDRMAPVGDD